MSEDPNSSNQNLSCCVTLCRNYLNTRSNTELFSLPADYSARRTFSKILGIPMEVAEKKNARVCALHFNSKNPELKRNAETVLQSGTRVMHSVPAPSNIAILGNTPTHVTIPFNSNFGPPVRFFLQRPFLNSSPVPNHGITFLQPTSSAASSTSILKHSILGSTSGTADIVDVSKEATSVLPNEILNSSVESLEEGIETQLDLQCEEELLSQAQLNSYYSDLVSFISANEKIYKIPVPAKTATVSVQTDPVTILDTDQIRSQEPCSSSITESSEQQSLQEEEEICIINQVSSLHATEDASHKITKVITTNTALLNSVPLPLISPRQNVETSSSASAISCLTSALKQLKQSCISTSTIPSSTLTNTYTYGDRSTSPASTPTIRYQIKPPPVYIPAEKTKETVPLINQVYSQTSLDSNLLNIGQPTVSPAIQKTYLKNQVQRETSWPTPQKARLQFFSIPSNQITGALPTYNFTAGDQTLQLLIQNNDQPNVLYSSNLSASGSTLSGLNSAPSTPVTNDNENDKEADLLGLCNVATVYGDDSPSQVSSDSGQTLALNPVTGILEKLQKMTNSVSGNSLNINAPKEIESPQNCGTFLNSMGPFIVDVISATEGAKDYYVGDKIPNILFNKNIRKSREEKKMYGASLPITKSPQAGDKISNVPFGEKEVSRGSSTDTSKIADGLPPTIKLNSSVFLFQKSIPILPTGSQLVASADDFLTWLYLPVVRSRSAEADVLRTRLKTEKFITCSVWWMIRRNYLPMISPCSCKCHTFTIHRSSQFADGFYWQCENLNCLKKAAIRRPKFFENFKSYTLEELLLLTFHWACQTPFDEVIKEVNLDSEKILAYYQALRSLCHQVSRKKCKLGLSPDHVVEAGLVKLGSYFALGAYDRNTKYTRLEVLQESQAYSSTLHIELLKTWLSDKAILVTEQKISDETLKGIMKLQANPIISACYAKEPHTLNIMKYLLSNLSSIFGKVNTNFLSLEQVKGLLYELQWRAKYGKFLDMAFWSILNNIRDLNDSKKGQITAKPGNLNIDAYCDKMPAILRKNWAPVAETGIAILGKKKLWASKKVSPKKMHTPKTYTIPDVVVSAIKTQKTMSVRTPRVDPSKKNVGNLDNCCILFGDVPEIPGGTSNINSKSLLAIKIRCEDSTPPGVYKPNATSLGLQLRTEGFISNPVKWLVKRGYLSGRSPCYVCRQTAVLQSNDKFKDGCSWSCQNENCKFKNMFKRPLFFARFNEQPMAQIAAMIFHWTVQSDYNIVVSDVPLEPVKISHAWRAFQVLCSSALKRENFKVGGEGQIVEVALVQFGRLYILGARHRITKRTLLKCFPMERFDQVQMVHDTLRNWIIPGSHVTVNSTSLFSMEKSYVVFNADTSITDKASTQMHVLNITSYLLKHVFEMFGHLRADLVKPHLMQVYLDELMWRERFGKLPNLAFAKIMYEIFYHEKHSNSFLQHHHFNFSVKELLEEEPQIPVFQKEVCVVLHRIPKTVLKYYNCWPIPTVHKYEEASSKPVEISHSDEESISRILSEENFQFNDSNDSVQCNQKRKKSSSSSKRIIRFKGKIVQIPSDDESSSSSEEDWSGDGGNTSPGVSDESSNEELDEDNPLAHKSKRRKTIVQGNTASIIKKEPGSDDVLPPMNSVQKLVIKMNKNSQKCQSYFKSEIVKAKYKKQRSKRLFNVKRSRKKSQNKSRSKTSLSPNKSRRLDVVIKREIMDEEPGPSGYCLSADSENVGAKSARRRTVAAVSGKQICIECGKEVKFEHFMKRFSCTDCTKSIYTTCCRNAFFEHRSALLFGKRPARRERVEKVNYGLHRSCTLSYTVACPCGFKTKVGNKMALHLVKCQQSSCIKQS